MLSFLLNPFPLTFQAVRTMRVGANLQLVADGLGMLEMATAGVDLPQLWSVLETFFGKVNESFKVPPQGGTSGHSSTYCAKRKMTEGWIHQALLLFIPGFRKKSQVTLLFCVLILNFSQIQIYLTFTIYINLLSLLSQV